MSGVGLAVLVATLAIASVAGLVLRARDGRARAGRAGQAGPGGWTLAGPGPGPGDRVLLLQLSSPVCTPCRRTAELLTGFTARTPGVVHREVDVAERPDVARELGVMRTPTVVAFDRAGAEVLRVSGVPRLSELESLLAAG